MKTTSHNATHPTVPARPCAAGSRTGRPDGRRGAALMLAIIVLAALFLLAAPFAVFMKMHHSSGTQALHTARARFGAAGALSHSKAVLAQGLDIIEDSRPVFPFDNREVDTLWEFHVTLRTRATSDFAIGDTALDVANVVGFPNDDEPDTVDAYIRVDDEWMAYSDVTNFVPTGTDGTLTVLAVHRGLFGTGEADHDDGAIVSFFPSSELWDLDVQDQQALINVNTAPYDVILNLLQELEIADGDLGRQQDLARAITTYRLYYSLWEGGGVEYTPFQNLNMLKNIAVAPYFDSGNPPLSGQEFDRLRRYVTVHSSYTGTTRWWGSFSLDGNILLAPAGDTPETNQFTANLNNANGIGVGTIVRLTDTGTGVPEYRIVASRNEDTAIGPAGVLAGAGTTVPIDSAAGFRQMSVDTPGYIFVNDPVPANREWISYTGVDTTVAPPELTGVQGNVFGTPTVGVAFDHAGGVPLDGCVISWEYPLGITYTAGVDEIRAEARHAININTATSPIVLRSLLFGIDDGTNDIGTTETTNVAEELLAYTSGETVTTPEWFAVDQRENWFDGDADNDDMFETMPLLELTDFFDTLVPGTITAGQAQLLKDNFSEDASLWPAVSTVPLRFNSGTLIGINSQGVVDNPAGTPIAQAPTKAGLTVARVYDVVPPLAPLFWVLRSQSDFYTHMNDTLLSSKVFTSPLNEGIDPPFSPANTDIYEDVSAGIGTVAPKLGHTPRGRYTTVLEGLHENLSVPPRLPHFDLDYSIAADTAEVYGVTAGEDNTTSQGIKNVRLAYSTRYDEEAGDRHIEADSFDATMQPVAVEFWMRPGENVTARQLLVDVGLDANPDQYAAVNQIRVYLEGGQIVLRIDEPVYTPPNTPEYAGYAGYVEAKSSTPAFQMDPDEWHHVAIAVVGTFRDETAMFIDGIYDRDMEWEYRYYNSAGTALTATVATGINPVEEGSFHHVAIEHPNKQWQVTVGPDNPPANNWGTTRGVIGIEELDGSSPPVGLPQQGCVVIGTSDEAYAYDDFSSQEAPIGSGNFVFTLQLRDFDGTPIQLRRLHNQGELIAFMVPVARTVRHTGASYAPPVPAVDQVTFYRHNEMVGGNGSYRLGASGPASETVGYAATCDVTAFPQFERFRWLGLDPIIFPIGGGGDLMPDDRWKVLIRHDTHVSADEGVLSGTLPTGDLGPNFSVGGARDATEVFEGELDELRITALPIALVAPGPAGTGWGSDAVNGTVVHWEWNTAVPPTQLPGLHVVNGSRFDMMVPSGERHMRDGGYFLVEGELYSYVAYDGVTLEDVARVNDDLTPAGADGFAEDHEALRKIIPLNFLTTTRIDEPGGMSAADQMIILSDVDGLPDSGYLKVEDEIFSYDEVQVLNWPRGQVRLNQPPTRRGCYGTIAAEHPDPALPAGASAGWLVRLLPVRHVDRYRAESTPGTWNVHTTYNEPQINADMCMYSFSINHAGRQLRRIWWHFKEPLQDNQKVAVVVMIDGAELWSNNPDALSTDEIWGTVCEGVDTEGGALSVYTDAGERPTVDTGVEVRFYFDLSETQPYGTTWDSLAGAPDPTGGWSKMVELDEVGIEMVPMPMTF